MMLNKIRNTLPRFGAVLVGAALLAGAPFAGAVPPFMEGGQHDLRHAEKLAKKLDLTDAQRAEFTALQDAGRERMREHVGALMQGREAMRGLIEAEVFDENAARRLAAEHATAMSEMMVERARQQHALRAMLSAQQRDKLAAMHERHHDRRERHRGNHERE